LPELWHKKWNSVPEAKGRVRIGQNQGGFCAICSMKFLRALKDRAFFNMSGCWQINIDVRKPPPVQIEANEIKLSARVQIYC
jgi:hypothetical protein